MRLINSTTDTVESKLQLNTIALIMQFILKALLVSAFFMFYGLQASVFAEEVCRPPTSPKPEQANIRWVYDGDTIQLQDKRRIRIIGIDTPEKKRKNKAAEPFSGQAREALRALLKKFNNKVTLYYGLDRKDKYKRTLAHVYLEDGTNISQWLLEKGLATTLAIPPNVRLAYCLKEAEENAQQNKKNIWSLKSHAVTPIENLRDHFKGYIRLAGQIKRVKRYKKTYEIELLAKSKRPIIVKLKHKHLRYFESLNFKKLINRRIIVSGMLRNKHGKRVISVRHPSQINVL